ncbi:MAG: serpin family protein [Clostridiaceae bacterium]|jgi:serpin B|nr:serpin family protein [Clostridiaceae bacterium]
MKKFLSCLIAAIMLFLLTSCIALTNNSFIDNTTGPKGINQPEYPKGFSSSDYEAMRQRRDENPVNDSTYDAIHKFSYNTAAQVFKEVETNNCYSPLSLYYALALAATGAEGSTKDELSELLGFDNVFDLSKECGNLYRLLYTHNEISRLKIANSLWLDNDMNGQEYNYKEPFLKNATDNFYASLFSVDFSDESTGALMGQWISSNTNGRIAPKLNVDTQQIMSILNTVYFYDEWINRFNKANTKKDSFYPEDSESVLCDFMNMTNASQSFSRGEGYTRSSLGLKNSGSMVFILPDEGVSVRELLSSPERIEDIFTGGERRTGEVIWSIPKFGYSSSFDLTEPLKNLNINSAFSMDADFSGITDGIAFISGVKQQTYISIDENGVEASAFTNIAYAGSAMPEDNAEMILNRPFVYGITTRSGILLFVGVCINPTID